MREKYNTLALKDLKAIAKIRGIKGYYTMSKDEIIDAMVKLDEEEANAAAAPKAEPAKTEKEAPAKEEKQPAKRGRKKASEAVSEPAAEEEQKKPLKKSDSETSSKSARARCQAARCSV